MTHVSEQGVGQSGRSLEALRSTALFSNLSEEELAGFRNAARFRSYKKGKILFLQGDPADFFYVLCGGWIKLFQIMPEGEEIIIDMLTSGDTVGENSIFEKGNHTASAQVVESVQLFSIPSTLLKDQIRQNPSLAWRMLSLMSQRHRQHYSEMALNAMKSAPQRIGCFLLRLCPENQTSAVLSLPYDKSLIAYVLGMKGATFSRALNILRQRVNVRVNGTRVEVDSVKQLVEFVYGPLYKAATSGDTAFSNGYAETSQSEIADQPAFPTPESVSCSK